MSLRAAMAESKKLQQEAEQQQEVEQPQQQPSPPKRIKKTASKATTKTKVIKKMKVKVKRIDKPIHPVPAPKSAFVIHAGATHEKAREKSGLKGMTKNICMRWNKLTKNQKCSYENKEIFDKKRFEKSQRKKVQLTFTQLLQTFLFPQGLEILESEVARTIDTWNGGHNDSCEACGRGGDIILCEGCNCTYHPKCLKIKDIAAEGWLCPECSEELYRKVAKNVQRTEKLKLKAELLALDQDENEDDEDDEEEEEEMEEEMGESTLETEEEREQRKLRKRARKEAKRMRKQERQEKREKRKRRSQERENDDAKPTKRPRPTTTKSSSSSSSSGYGISSEKMTSMNGSVASTVASTIGKDGSSAETSQKLFESTNFDSEKEKVVPSASSSSPATGKAFLEKGPGFDWTCKCSWKNRGANSVCGGGSQSHGCGSRYVANDNNNNNNNNNNQNRSRSAASSSRRSTDREKITVKFCVPANLAGAVIGRGGCMLKETREKSGATVKIHKEEPVRLKNSKV